jgi:hypothetical protein
MNATKIKTLPNIERAFKKYIRGRYVTYSASLVAPLYHEFTLIVKINNI